MAEIPSHRRRVRAPRVYGESRIDEGEIQHVIPETLGSKETEAEPSQPDTDFWRRESRLGGA